MINNSHLTAFRWNKPSQALIQLLNKSLVRGRVLDFGCGHGRDFRHLIANGFNADAYDPYYRPQPPTGKYDTIICNFVLSVLEPQDRQEVINEIDKYIAADGRAYITVTRNIKRPQWSVRHTFQDYVKLNLPIIFENSKYCIYSYRKGQQNIIGENFIGGVTAADKRRVRALEKQAMKMIKTIAAIYDPLQIAYSGGKDSEILYHLCQKAQINFQAYYNSTTIDEPGTITWVATHPNTTINRPPRTFFDILRHRGFPSSDRRFCCRELKHRRIGEYVITGVRAAESKKRREKYNEPEQCIRYANGKTSRQLMPLLNWTDKDIETYITIENIKCHPHYYDNEGRFQVKRRIGCLACPLRNDHGKAQFQKYPKLVRLWIEAMADYRLTRTKPINTVTNYRDEHEAFYAHVNGLTVNKLKEQRKAVDYNPKQNIEETFKIKLPPPRASMEIIQSKIKTTKQATENR